MGVPNKCSEDPCLSIIVPVYQVAPYLEKCVASILGQTFSDFEVLLVDDGSTDGSGAICDALVQKDARVRVIHKENGGVSSARNIGLDAARGRYIGFVDADDWIEPAFYEKLVRNLETHPEADFCIGGVRDVYPDGRVCQHYAKTLEYQVMTAEQAMTYVGERNHFTCYVWANLYKREVFQSLRFWETLDHSEDLVLIMELLEKVRSVVYDPAPLYYYRQRDDSRVHRLFSYEDSQMRAIEYIFAHVKMGHEAWQYFRRRYLRAAMRLIFPLYFENMGKAEEHLLAICDGLQYCANVDISDFAEDEQDLMRRLTSGRDGFFACLDALREDFYRQIATIRQSSKRVYLYGNGRLAGYLKRAFADQHLSYDGIVVSDGQAQQTAEQECEVVPLSKLEGPLEDAVFLLALGPVSAKKVKEQLAQRGYKRCYWPSLFHYLMKWR